jgi:hypothetical protein
MITLTDYFAGYVNHPDITQAHIDNAVILLAAVNGLLTEALRSGKVDLETNPKTGTLISATKNGGWRPKNCPEGAPNSSHKEGKGIDVYDPDGDIDEFCVYNLTALEKYGLYLEEPGSTRGWCHLTTRRPNSGNRVFYP